MRARILAPVLVVLACASTPEGPVDEPAQATTEAPKKAPQPGDLIPVDDNLYGRFFYAQEAPKIGDQAPRFTLPTSEGGEFSLDDALAKGKPVVVYFYRGFW